METSENFQTRDNSSNKRNNFPRAFTVHSYFRNHPDVTKNTVRSSLEVLPREVSSVDDIVHNNLICLTPICIETASRSVKSLDDKIDPCVDFYSFACGKFIKEQALQDKSDFESGILALSDTVTKQLYRIIREPPSNNFTKRLSLNTFFDHCMNSTNSQEEIQNIRNILNSVGEWPMLIGKEWNETKFDVKELTYRLKKIGIPYDLVFVYGNDRGEFIKLRDFSNDTGVDWVLYLQRLFDGHNVTITNDEIINFSKYNSIMLKYFLKLSKRLQANIYFINIINWMYEYLPGVKRMLTYKVPKYSKCVAALSKRVPLLVNSLYVKNYFKIETKIQVEKLVTNVRNEFLKILQAAEWLDDKTRKNALEKLTSMKTCVGYPDELIDDTKLDKYYETLNVNYTTYLNIIMSIQIFELNKQLKRLREPVQKCYWIDTSNTVTIINAVYYCLNNGIQLPAAFFQDIVFDKDRPNYINYATAGMIVGHEMTHGFDDLGKMFDKNGNYKQWWSNQTLKTFNEKTECIIKQYKSYVISDLNVTVNGVRTLGENIADNGGLKQSFLAYSNWVKQNGPERPLPGLNYTSNQMFWIAFAQFWCSYQSIQYQQKLLHDVHAPSRFRVIGTLSNLERFAEDFNCPIGSPMNPKNKCKIW
ncbi:hypothetical protein FQR65_LT04619 [Abscondita terminalis]|nr:hypothetical protein FQR65_LT04619 [Abscondita terminalis]